MRYLFTNWHTAILSLPLCICLSHLNVSSNNFHHLVRCTMLTTMSWKTELTYKWITGNRLKNVILILHSTTNLTYTLAKEVTVNDHFHSIKGTLQDAEVHSVPVDVDHCITGMINARHKHFFNVCLERVILTETQVPKLIWHACSLWGTSRTTICFQTCSQRIERITRRRRPFLSSFQTYCWHLTPAT